MIHLNRFFNHLILLLITILPGGCAAVGPDYISPDVPAPVSWHTGPAGGINAENTDARMLAHWWTTLNDPILSGLIGEAVAENLSLKEARARVREARARRGISRASLFPALDISGSAGKSRSSENSGSGSESELYSTGFDAGWELDIFGGVRRAVEAADADLQASRADLQDVRVSIAAEVALNYVEMRTYQTRLTVAEANLSAQKETYELTRSRYEAGLSDELAVQQARYNMESTRSQLPTLRTGLEEALNRLAVLLGEQPGTVHDRLKMRRAIPVAPAEVAVGVPAETLRRRPDVRQAERSLAAQTARIGEAVADLYPKFRLSGSIGLESLSSGSLLSGDSHTYSFGPAISWPIFDAGAIRNNIAVQSALQEQALIQYQSAVLNALEEVENALVAYAEEQLRRTSLQKATRAAKKAADLAGNKYMAGLIDFSEVLDAQRSLLSFQDDLAQSDGAITANLITLYKALGGGWTSLAGAQNNITTTGN
ncbi:RND transporter [Desulfonema ishimotonii]|uniref:RND transporter n=1 Tax=Desulfonema ishimotonii TaxID=45657 RepID=A0A401FVZ7_9BACT|nr:efflux transporter outer membrane subunit [Desulfonema ishimotonii]GBC61138.1 RND transporter [Desulfonema ishimotonii]